MPRTKEPRDWACQECGKRMTLKQANRATMSDRGCPKCGGADIDLAPGETTIPAPKPIKIAPQQVDDVLAALVFHSWSCSVARKALERADLDARRIRAFLDIGECCRQAAFGVAS